MKKLLVISTVVLSAILFANAQDVATTATETPTPVVPAVTIGDVAVDNKIRELNKEMNAKIRALHEEYKKKLKELIGERKATKPNMASSTAREVRKAVMMASSTIPRPPQPRLLGQPIQMGQQGQVGQQGVQENRMMNFFRGFFGGGDQR